jgi:hypothetical protein
MVLVTRCNYVLECIPSGVPVPVLAGNFEPALARFSLPGKIIFGMYVEQSREITGGCWPFSMSLKNPVAPFEFEGGPF